MGRRQFKQDLAATNADPPPHITDIQLTENDGEIGFNYLFTGGTKCSTIELRLLATDIDEYPEGNEYMVFTDDDGVPSAISNAFESLIPRMSKKTVQECLKELSTGLTRATTVGQSANPILIDDAGDADDDSQIGSEDEFDALDGNDVDTGWFDDDDEVNMASGLQNVPIVDTTFRKTAMTALSATDLHKMRSDLRTTKAAGFKIGVFGDPSTTSIVSVSIRIDKLGISEEAMQAWSLRPAQYLVLLIRFRNGYQNLNTVSEQAVLSDATEIRVGLCSSYKPSSSSAINAFTEQPVADSQTLSQSTSTPSPTDLQPLFIGRSLNELMRTRFSLVVKFRAAVGLGWSGAEQLVHDTQGAILDNNILDRYHIMVDDTDKAFPDLVLADSLRGCSSADCSLPLVAMQFLLRHLVRCTEFCLVCHCKSGDTFEALKPYVCSSPLCLYQYMSLGFGPSIEWEVISQPYVVDLLVSFCYSQARNGRLRDFPLGIGLKVPILPTFDQFAIATPRYSTVPNIQPASNTLPTTAPKVTSSKASYNAHKRELSFGADGDPPPSGLLRVGDFIALGHPQRSREYIHHRIDDIVFPSMRLGPPIITNVTKDVGQVNDCLDKFVTVDCYPFSNNFDELSDQSKSAAILAMLDMIPPVKDMVTFLTSRPGSREASLREWRWRISDPALNILRWIIASNRSCIMQVDDISQDETHAIVRMGEDRVSGMDGYMQFRFAQGAPDKEQRFVDCVKQNTQNKECPTLFAWHGSPLHNWHSIIREGLHHRETAHGRAFGNGVYMSPHASTSTSYANMHHNTPSEWSNSILKVTSAMSLNEVVNNPTAFVSSTPHYVVADVDWIQTRYLLVKTSISHSTDSAISEQLEQDPAHPVYDAHNSIARIPVTAISKSRRSHWKTTTQKSSKRKSASLGYGTSDAPIEIEDDVESIVTIDDDRQFLLEHEASSRDEDELLSSLSSADMESPEDDGHKMLPRKKFRSDAGQSPTAYSGLIEIAGALMDVAKTQFRPNTWDMTNVEVLPPPDDASRSATTALLKAFNALVKTQASTPAHDLGWYVNPESTENVYQWITELHSFDESLPLASDLKKAGLTSVLLEMRFTNSFPFAPPFVRVIKPRFLPFRQGGGGHVLEGGSICMELLTDSGWSVVSTIESVLMQIRLAMSEKEHPSRLASTSGFGGGSKDVYSVGEAIMAYERACLGHGWKIPESFQKFKQGYR